ncbi:hypothetical protein MVEN_00257900 [Mycena venus]|uniref:DUF6593 domain-containing protein n=1 Tax=Mycena venus TaxID=2733690 RepID=A0A8H6YYC0_9AGAR|nr:hypothetical protein MVEN_00257900 [Mycena venus]
MHPYTQGRWRNPANPNAPGSSRNPPPQPSVFGALPDPYRSRAPKPALIPFTFTSFRPNVLNCTVTGPQSRVYFRITTDTPTVGYTVFFDSAGQPVTIIEWRNHPVVEIRGILSKRSTSDWLPLSQNGSHRQMEALGKHFVWVPGGEYIFLYAAGVGQPQVYAQVSRAEDSVTLELTAEAIQIGLLEICVAATFLLQCGKSID